MEPNYGYKHTRGFIVLLIIIFCGWVIVAHSAESSLTGNIVTNTWTNGHPVSELTCWKGGDPNCSPGGRPYVTPTGINFSYTYTELFQARAIADVLPYSGAGIIVTGFQFDWRSKNGNHWDDARQDQLSAYVQMYSKSGKWIEAQSYDLNFIHNWTDFSWSGTFSKERRGDDLGTILYGFAGKDNNYWVGPYGPEITNVNFQLRYQSDPCVVNPLHSTECPGFMAAITKPIPGVSENIITQVNSNAYSPSVSMAMNSVKLNTQRDIAILEFIVDQPVSTVQNTTTTMIPNLSITNNSVNKSVNRTDNPQIIEQEQTSIVVNTLSSVIITPVQLPQISKPLQRSEPVAKTDTVTENIPLEQVLLPIQINSESQIPIQIGLVRTPEIILPTPEQNIITIPDGPISDAASTITLPSIQPFIVVPIAPEQPNVEFVRTPQVEMVTVEQSSNIIANALLDRTNPLNNILNDIQIPQSSPVFAGPTVKTNTADNDLAGTISIGQIARVPVGFDSYENLAIREIAFYQPREIYRGQRTVDNVRALRSLGQDVKHQEMVNQQYLQR